MTFVSLILSLRLANYDARLKAGVRHERNAVSKRRCGAGGACACDDPKATVDELLGGYRQLIDVMHSRGLRVLHGTLTPVGGLAGAPPDTEAKRQAVNTWIRGQSPADAVVDFDAAVRDPADPSRIAPYFDGSDHLHLNLAGYLAMGNAVPLELLLDPACS